MRKNLFENAEPESVSPFGPSSNNIKNKTTKENIWFNFSKPHLGSRLHSIQDRIEWHTAANFTWNTIHLQWEKDKSTLRLCSVISVAPHLRAERTNLIKYYIGFCFNACVVFLFVSASSFYTRRDGRLIRPLDQHGDYICCHFSRVLGEGSKVHRKKENKEVDKLHPGQSIAYEPLKSKYNKLINRIWYEVRHPGIQVTIHSALRKDEHKTFFSCIFFSWSNFVPVADFSRCNEKWICSDFEFSSRIRIGPFRCTRLSRNWFRFPNAVCTFGTK